MALTTKQRAFVDAVRKGASNKDAAIAAGYAASSASVAGSRLAKHPSVLAALASSPINKNVKAVARTASAKPPATDLDDNGEEPTFDFSKAMTFTDPKAFLIATMNDYDADAKLRVDAAKALMPFIHSRKGEGGKKEEKENAAKTASQGKFGAAPPPPAHLRSVK